MLLIESTSFGTHGYLTRYVKLWVAHAPGMPGTFSRHRGLVISTCFTARAWRTCRDAWRDRLIAVFFQVGGGENVPDISGSCATRNFPYLARGPYYDMYCSPLSTDLLVAFPWRPLDTFSTLECHLLWLNSVRPPTVERLYPHLHWDVHYVV